MCDPQKETTWDTETNLCLSPPYVLDILPNNILSSCITPQRRRGDRGLTGVLDGLTLKK